jgi:hypothetical protein
MSTEHESFPCKYFDPPTSISGILLPNPFEKVLSVFVIVEYLYTCAPY